MLVPALAYAGELAALLLVWKGRTLTAFVASSFAIVGVIGTAGVSMFPFVMPSSTVPGASLAGVGRGLQPPHAGHHVLGPVIFMPIIVTYTSWAYSVMAGKVTAAYIRENEHSAY